MYVSVEKLQVGFCVKESVMGETNYPLIASNTILTEQHIRFLKAFSIQSVDVVIEEDSTLSPFPAPSLPFGERPAIEAMEQIYFKTLKKVKAEFQRWQSGMNVEIARIRTIILPILEYTLQHPDQMTRIFSYSKKDEYLYHHALSVSLLSGMMASKLNEDKGLIVQAALSGLLADCGMSKMTMSLLAKKTALTEKEYKEIQNHPIVSYKMVKDLTLLKPEAKLAIYQHHERLDGSGYPAGTKGDKIHTLAQVVGLADTYHALTTERVFKPRMPLFKAVEVIQQDLFGQFAFPVMEALFSLIIELSPGMNVQLSDGRQGKILFIQPDNKTRPLIQLAGGEVMDLTKNRDLYIEEVDEK